MPSTDPEQFAGNLAEQAIAAGDPTAWFEQVYAAADAGQTEVPWDRGTPSHLLVQWARRAGLAGSPGQQAVVVGCGLGEDAEFIAGLGYQTSAFDISPSAIAAARRRFPAVGRGVPRREPARPTARVASGVRPGGGEPDAAGAARSAAGTTPSPGSATWSRRAGR